MQNARMESLNPIVDLLATGAIAGYFVGYFIKKVMHLAFTIGVFIFLLMYMLHVDAIDLNFEELGATITGYADVLLDRLGFAALVSSTPFVGSFVVDLVLGLRKG